MSILTPAMRRYRDALVADSNCKIWFPCDEGEGTTLTDVIGSVVETDLSATHNEPHAITAGKALAAPTSGIYPELEANFLLVLSQKVFTSESFISLKFGSDTFVHLSSGIASCDYELGTGDEAATPANSPGAAANDTILLAAAVIGDTLYHYASVNQAGVTINGSADASGFVAAFAAGNKALDNAGAFGNAALRQHIYGMALFTFDKDEFTTTEVVAALNEIDGNWQNGKKYLPESIL